MQYGKGGRHAHGAMCPDSPEGDLTEAQLAENICDMPKLSRHNESIDDQFFKERCSGSEDLSKIEVPLLSAGNWVCVQPLKQIEFV